MLANVTQIDITPPVGVAMTGYIARDGDATGVHDPLYAKALVLDEGERRAALITCDIVGLHRAFTALVRNEIQLATDIPAANILIACSHTHAGPATMFLQDCGEIDEGYMAVLRQKLVEVASAAAANLRPARLGLGRGQVTAGIHNRRQPGDVIDPELGVLRIDDEQGQAMAVVLNYACHPTCLAGENRLISAEYPGYVVDKIQRVTGATAMFITGAIGDVGPAERGWPVLERVGEAIAGEALRVLDNISVSDWSGLAVATQVLELPLLPPPTVESLELEVARWAQPPDTAQASTLPPHPKIREAMLHWAERTLAQVRTGQALKTVTTEVQVIRAGTLVFVSAPGELFVELGLAIKQNSGAEQVFLCGFGNDNIGYIPTRRAYPYGGYEIVDAYKYYGYSAALAPEAGEQYIEATRRLIDEVKR